MKVSKVETTELSIDLFEAGLFELVIFKFFFALILNKNLLLAFSGFFLARKTISKSSIVYRDLRAFSKRPDQNTRLTTQSEEVRQAKSESRQLTALLLRGR